MRSATPNNNDDKNTPPSKRFRPISKMVSKVNQDFLSRDPFPEPSRSKTPTSERGIHVATPAKTRLGGFFGGGAATPSGPSSRSRRSSAAASDLSGTSNNLDVPPVPKIRAGMTPEARARHLAPPKPIPRTVLGASNSHNSQMNGGDRPSTIRMIRHVSPEAGEGEDDTLLPMLPALSSRGSPHLGETVDEMEVLEKGMDDVSLDNWNASSESQETVVVTVR